MPRYRFPDEEPINEEFPQQRHWPEYSGPEETREMDNIHADLVLYDSGMAGILSSIGNGAYVRPLELRPYPELRARIQKVIAEGSPAASKDAARYLEYLGQMEREVERARKHVISLKR